MDLNRLFILSVTIATLMRMNSSQRNRPCSTFSSWVAFACWMASSSAMRSFIFSAIFMLASWLFISSMRLSVSATCWRTIPASSASAVSCSILAAISLQASVSSKGTTTCSLPLALFISSCRASIFFDRLSASPCLSSSSAFNCWMRASLHFLPSSRILALHSSRLARKLALFSST